MTWKINWLRSSLSWLSDKKYALHWCLERVALPNKQTDQDFLNRDLWATLSILNEIFDLILLINQI